MSFAALSLGSNQVPEPHLRAAIAALCHEFPGARISSAWQFPAIGFDGPAFVNAAAVIETRLDPWQLNHWLRTLEETHGRDRSGPRYGNRTLDIDIVLFDARVIAEANGLRIPRNELQHAFVLKPLADIAPDWQHPQLQCSIGRLWAQHPQYQDIFTQVDLS